MVVRVINLTCIQTQAGDTRWSGQRQGKVRLHRWQTPIEGYQTPIHQTVGVRSGQVR